MNETLEYSDFKYYFGETLEHSKTVEHDIKWIYVLMIKGNPNDTLDRITEWSLGTTVKHLKRLDYSDSKHYLGIDDYKLLQEKAGERNYLFNKIYHDFLYTKEWKKSEAYRRVCSRMMNFHNRLEKLQIIIQKVRLEAVKTFAK